MIRKYARGWSISFESRNFFLPPLFSAVGAEVFSGPPLWGIFYSGPPILAPLAQIFLFAPSNIPPPPTNFLTIP